MYLERNILKEPDPQLIHTELVKLVAAFPAMVDAIVVTFERSPVLSYCLDESRTDDSIYSIAAGFLSGGERIAADQSLGKIQYLIASGSKGIAIYLPIGKSDFDIILVVSPDTILETFLRSVMPYCESLEKYF